MAMTFGVGIIGLGMAGGFMAPIIAAHPALRLAAAAELDPDLRERFERQAGVAADQTVELMLRRPEVDIVYIATPHQFHRAHAVAALEAGKHVVVEKPLALSIEDCDAIIEAADRADRVLIVGHTHGFDPAPRRIGELIQSGVYGRLAMITLLNFTDFIYRPRRPEELDTAKGGGVFFNQLPHQIEMARVIAREPVRSVRCVSGMIDPRRPTEGHLAALIMFDSGAVASITYGGHDRFDTDELHFGVGEAGYPKTPSPGAAWRASRELAGPEAEAAVRRERYGYGSGAYQALTPPPHQPHFGVCLASCALADLRASADGLIAYGLEGAVDIHLAGAGTFAGQVRVWDDCIAAITGAEPALQDGRFGRETVRICLAVLQSARENREIILT